MDMSVRKVVLLCSKEEEEEEEEGGRPANIGIGIISKE